MRFWKDFLWGALYYFVCSAFSLGGAFLLIRAEGAPPEYLQELSVVCGILVAAITILGGFLCAGILIPLGRCLGGRRM